MTAIVQTDNEGWYEVRSGQESEVRRGASTNHKSRLHSFGLCFKGHCHGVVLWGPFLEIPDN